jgi:drug/metabolite transporter (DMT)-like permease
MRHPTARLLLALAALGWGAATTATKYALSAFGPMTLLTIELVSAAVVLWTVMAIRRVPRPLRRRRLALLALFEPALAYGGLAFGLGSTTATKASLLGASETCFVVVLAAIFLRERMGPRAVFGVLLTVLGVLVIEQTGIATVAIDGGDLLVLGGDLAAAIYVVLAVRIAANTEALPMTAYQFGFGALICAPFTVWRWLSDAEPFPSSVDGGMWLVAVLIGGVGFVGSYLLYNHVISFVPAGLAGVTLNLIPLFGVLTAVLFLAEHPTVWHLIGGLVVIAGITLFPAPDHDERKPVPGRPSESKYVGTTVEIPTRGIDGGGQADPRSHETRRISRDSLRTGPGRPGHLADHTPGGDAATGEHLPQLGGHHCGGADRH